MLAAVAFVRMMPSVAWKHVAAVVVPMRLRRGVQMIESGAAVSAIIANAVVVDNRRDGVGGWIFAAAVSTGVASAASAFGGLAAAAAANAQGRGADRGAAQAQTQAGRQRRAWTQTQTRAAEAEATEVAAAAVAAEEGEEARKGTGDWLRAAH